MDIENLCMGCMRDKGGARVCAGCGFEEGTPPERPGRLWPRTVLAQKYVIGKVLGQGGFGITYLAWDTLLDRKLAIKEHYPREICIRGRDECTVQPLTHRLTDDYNYGLKKFVEEGRAMACFYDHPGIVLLLDFFEANGTAYIVMAYVAGMTFKQYLENHGGKIAFRPALDILTPVMDALREVHRMGMLHRDVSADNIYINEKKEVKILDFGSTRYAMREFSQVPAVKPGYSPIEQYGSSAKQGTWTDVYATAATLYRAITGQLPPEAPDRLRADPLVPPSRMGVQIPPASEKALLKALSVQARDRFQTVDHFWNALVPSERSSPVSQNGSVRKVSKWTVASLVAAGILLFTTIGFAAMWVHGRHTLPYRPDETSPLRSQIEDLQAKLAERQNTLDAEVAKNTALQTDLSSSEQQKQNLNSRIEQAKGNRAQLSTERDLLQTQLANAEATNSNLQQQLAGQRQLINSLQSQLNRKLTLSRSAVFYWDGEADLKRSRLVQQPDSNFDGKRLRYILCELSGPNPLPGKQYFSAALDVRFLGPDKQLKKRVLVGTISLPGEASWVAHAGWGGDKPSFSRGEWTVEVWCEGQRLGELRFRVG